MQWAPPPRAAADGALDGARGNSGAIFAQFLHGLASSVERLRNASGSQFADAALAGTESAYSALQEPREGDHPQRAAPGAWSWAGAPATTRTTCPS